MERTTAALMAFGAPVGLVLEELDAEGMLDTAVERMGKVFVSTELGGAGSTSIETMTVARRGLNNFLRHAGVLTGKLEAPRRPTRLMTNDAAGFVASDRAGLIEYLIEPGVEIRKGDVIARCRDLERPLETPHDFTAPCDGLLLGRLHGGLVQPGDFVALVGRDL
jgi:N-alpha-acetyl-L-2,4-diaminobutyrate deacetylase